MAMRGLIFDSDGVIADSEALANAVLAETVLSLGRVTTFADALSAIWARGCAFASKYWVYPIALNNASSVSTWLREASRAPAFFFWPPSVWVFPRATVP